MPDEAPLRKTPHSEEAEMKSFFLLTACALLLALSCSGAQAMTLQVRTEAMHLFDPVSEDRLR